MTAVDFTSTNKPHYRHSEPYNIVHSTHSHRTYGTHCDVSEYTAVAGVVPYGIGGCYWERMADPRSADGRGSSLSPASYTGNSSSSSSGAAPSQVPASSVESHCPTESTVHAYAYASRNRVRVGRCSMSPSAMNHRRRCQLPESCENVGSSGRACTYRVLKTSFHKSVRLPRPPGPFRVGLLGAR